MEAAMNNRNKQKIMIAKDVLDQLEFKVVGASVGGSVVRGEADEFSDLDLTICTDTTDRFKRDFFYADEIIQLEVIPLKHLPNKNTMINLPWDHRFIYEMSVIKDETDQLIPIKRWATHYFSTKNGKKKMLQQVNQLVSKRKEYAFACIKEQQLYSATNAALGAWTEAGFLYLFLDQQTLATDALISKIKQLKSHLKIFKEVAPFQDLGNHEADLWDIYDSIKKFRAYLRNKHNENLFMLAKTQDVLCQRKAQRLINQSDYYHLI